jgi:hypothetical protein
MGEGAGALTVWLALTPEPEGSGAMWTMLRPYLAEVLWKMVWFSKRSRKNSDLEARE